jgi:hypothetical protein
MNEAMTVYQPVRKLLRDFDGFSTPLISQQMPNTAATRTCEQPQLSVVRLAPQVSYHVGRVGTCQPFRFGHGSSLPQNQVHRPAAPDVRPPAPAVCDQVFTWARKTRSSWLTPRHSI